MIIELNGEEKLYFVVETKSSLFTDDLKDRELAKLACGVEHFKALASYHKQPARYVKASKLGDLSVALK